MRPLDEYCISVERFAVDEQRQRCKLVNCICRKYFVNFFDFINKNRYTCCVHLKLEFSEIKVKCQFLYLLTVNNNLCFDIKCTNDLWFEVQYIVC